MMKKEDFRKKVLNAIYQRKLKEKLKEFDINCYTREVTQKGRERRNL